MLDKFKQLKQLRDLQSQMKQERIEAEDSGVRAVMNGALEVEEIKLNPELGIEAQERALKSALKEVIRKAQTTIAQKFGGGLGL